MKKYLCLMSLAVLPFMAGSLAAGDIVWYDGSKAVSYQVEGRVAPVVEIALDMFRDDMLQVTGQRAVKQKDATIRIFQLDRNKGAVAKLRKMGVPTDDITGKPDAFYIGTSGNRIIIAGSNGRGCAYGILELSRMAGVSPWIWWGDVVPERRTRLALDDSYTTLQSPSVEYRGIFINDEDWTLRNWSWKHYEPTTQFGAMGPKTYKAVFQLLLRLRANAIWPGMHTGTPGFFTIAGNKEMADSCGILIGTSHCEPLLRNNVAEWDHATRGPYNYITNRDQVQQYWIERLKEVKGSEEFFTIGMRGIHDGSMEGVHTRQEKLEGLQAVIDDQRELIRKYYRKDVENVPQVFIPYKEVLEIMESGLNVPDDVTLMWCDDNYGYMTRLSDEEQQKRRGGGGVYYHLSYWGRPHDYMWLATTQPGLVYSEMKAAYDHNCRKLWIVNVHDPKIAAYDLELFLDMAWNIGSVQPQTINQHLRNWLCAQFGEKAGQKLFPAMKEFYRLCGIRKPEFMGWTQVELSDRKAYPRGRSHVIDTEFSEKEFGNELDRYLLDYARIAGVIAETKALIRPELHDAYFAAIEYPVLGAKAMAEKMLFAQKARSRYLGQTDSTMEGREDYMLSMSAASMKSYRTIQQLTDIYNGLGDGKWTGIMNMMPRELAVFNPPTVPYLPYDDAAVTAPVLKEDHTFNNGDGEFIARNADSYSHATDGTEQIQMLGHSMNAVALPKGGELTYTFKAGRDGEATLYTAMIPTQPNDKGDLRYSVQIDNEEPAVISLKEKFRSEFWKTSVLRGQALKETPVKVSKGQHTLKIKALDEHIIFDQWMIDFKKGRKFYVIPVRP